MSQIPIIEDCLFSYVQVILKFENVLVTKYNLPDNPYQVESLFPRIGTLITEDHVFDYRFHGRGSFYYLGMELHYDYDIRSPDYISIAPWKFWRFVTTFLQRKGGPNIAVIEMEEILEKLDAQEVVQRTAPNYLVYQVRFSWFKSYTPLKYYG